MNLHDDPRFVRFRMDRSSSFSGILFAASLPVELLVLLVASGYLEGPGAPENSYCRVVLHLGIPVVACAWFWVRSIRLEGRNHLGNAMAVALFLLVAHEGSRLFTERNAGDPFSAIRSVSFVGR